MTAWDQVSPPTADEERTGGQGLIVGATLRESACEFHAGIGKNWTYFGLGRLSGGEMTARVTQAATMQIRTK